MCVGGGGGGVVDHLKILIFTKTFSDIYFHSSLSNSSGRRALNKMTIRLS